MRKIFKLLVLAGLVYASWWVWKNYDLPAWYSHIKSAIARRDTRSALILPQKRGVLLTHPNTIYIKNGCEFLPKILEVKIGEKIIWQNISGREQQLIGGDFGTWFIAAGRTAAKTFNESGVFYFNCADNEQTKGQIIVE